MNCIRRSKVQNSEPDNGTADSPNHRRLTGAVALVAAIAILSGCSTLIREVPPSPEQFTSPFTSDDLPYCHHAPLPGKRDFSSAVVTEIAPIEMVEPVYPPNIAREGLVGFVTLLFEINKEGHPCNIALIRSKSVGVFVLSAVRALAQSSFKPATVNGKPVYWSATQTYIFRLGSSEKTELRLRALRGSEVPETEPAYPIDALMDKVEGSVVFIVNIDKKGEPVDYTIVKSIPKSTFDAHAAMALTHNQFKIRYRDGNPISYRGKAVYEFKLPEYFKSRE